MQNQTYWQKNLRLIAKCLVIWFVVSYGFGLLLVEPLNTIRMGGFKLGFWFAQQGSIYVFCALVFYYAWAMNKLDEVLILSFSAPSRFISVSPGGRARVRPVNSTPPAAASGRLPTAWRSAPTG
jgi:putative solute:sodium symporter small subunit